MSPIKSLKSAFFINAPVTLYFFGLSLIVTILAIVIPGINSMLAVGGFSPFNPLFWISLFTYPFAHGNWGHFFGNMMLLLLLAPSLEERKGSFKLLCGFAICSVVTGLFNSLVFNSNLIGASGLVFMCITYISVTQVKENKLPITFLLVCLIYFSRELYDSFHSDNVSQFAHIAGGVIGFIMGYMDSKSNTKSEDADTKTLFNPTKID